MEARELILQYLRHVEEEPYLRQVVASCTTAELCGQMAELLCSEDPALVGPTLALLRDLSLVAPDEIKAPFRSGLADSGVFEVLGASLHKPGLWLRTQTIYTLGKIGFLENAEALRAAFGAYLAADPICALRAHFELGWLTDSNEWALLDKLVTHVHYAFRWVAVEALEEHELCYASDDEWGRALDALDGLTSDVNASVAKRAAYALEEMKGIRQGGTHAGPSPWLTSEMMVFLLLGKKGRTDYDLGMMDEAIREIAAKEMSG